MLALALWVLRRWAAHVSLEDLWTELSQIPAQNILLALVFTFASFVALFGYEYYACQFIGRPISWFRAGIISFITQSITHAVGFAIVVGATVRYKLYSAIGFNLFEVAKVQLFFVVTFGLGCLVLGGGTLLIEPYVLARATGISELWWRLAGSALLALVAGVLVWGAWFHRPIRVGGQVFVLPRPRSLFCRSSWVWPIWPVWRQRYTCCCRQASGSTTLRRSECSLPVSHSAWQVTCQEASASSNRLSSSWSTLLRTRRRP